MPPSTSIWLPISIKPIPVLVPIPCSGKEGCVLLLLCSLALHYLSCYKTGEEHRQSWPIHAPRVVVKIKRENPPSFDSVICAGEDIPSIHPQAPGIVVCSCSSRLRCPPGLGGGRLNKEQGMELVLGCPIFIDSTLSCSVDGSRPGSSGFGVYCFEL